MIGYVKGILEEIEEDCVIVDVNGLGIRILTGGALASQMLGPICRRISYFSIIAVILSRFLVKFTAICYNRGGLGAIMILYHSPWIFPTVKSIILYKRSR